jgi:3-oxoacyl-[acyl-carrier protein] reductase
MKQPLKNKIALVTGGAGGIGEGICKKLAEEGASIIITYNSNAERAENLAKILRGGNHSVFHAPTTDSEKVNALADFVKKKYGRLDILVNNAGITTPVAHADLDGLTDEWIDKIMQTNVRGTFAMVRAFKDLLENEANIDGGLVVNISSVAGTIGIGSNVAYCASKAAIDSITRSLGRALAPKIRVVSVSPGFVEGEYAKSFPAAFLQMQMDATPLNRFATPEDVANTVFALTTYLTFTTGSIIPVDGGRFLK